MAAAGAAGKRRNQIAGQFAPRPIAMLESPSYQVLTLAAHKALSRLEIEHAHHGGKDNGRLPCTYQHFEEYRVHKNMIAPAIRELVALGFVEITQQGRGGNAEFRLPTLYRLTYRNAVGQTGDGTHDYLKVGTITEAEHDDAAPDRDHKGFAQGLGWRQPENACHPRVDLRQHREPRRLVHPRDRQEIRGYAARSAGTERRDPRRHAWRALDARDDRARVHQRRHRDGQKNKRRSAWRQ